MPNCTTKTVPIAFRVSTATYRLMMSRVAAQAGVPQEEIDNPIVAPTLRKNLLARIRIRVIYDATRDHEKKVQV